MAWQDRAYNNERGRGDAPVGFGLPPVTPLAIGLILTCLAVFLVQSATGPVAARSYLVEWGSLTFSGGRAFTQPWRWITYQYLHGGGLHIFFNCLGIFFFVPRLEQRWGWKATLAFYTAGGIAAGILFGVMSAFVELRPLIGASGSIMAALGACALLFPEMQLILLFFVVPIRMAAALFGIVYFLMVIGDRNLADAAHLGGLAFGFLAPLLLAPTWLRLTRNIQLRRVRRQTVEEQQEQESVDLILQKVHDQGLDSLTWRERRTLRRATERQRQRDLELSRRRCD